VATEPDALSAALDATGLEAYVDAGRCWQIATFVVVGASGVPIDLFITTSAIPVVGVLVAQAAGWIVAASWNHAWNRRLTWNTDQSILYTWTRYLVVDSGRLALRIGAVAVLVAAGARPLVATLTGIAVATAAGFLGFDRVVFDD